MQHLMRSDEPLQLLHRWRDGPDTLRYLDNLGHRTGKPLADALHHGRAQIRVKSDHAQVVILCGLHYSVSHSLKVDDIALTAV